MSNAQRDDDDPELRRLLASIGMDVPSSRGDDQDPEAWLRAEAMLASVLQQPREAEASQRGARSWRFDRPYLLVLVAAACALVTLLFLVPGSGSKPAAAQTPPILSFQGTRELPPTGKAGRTRLEVLADRATDLPPPADLPVQWVTTEGWSSSADLAAGSASAQSVLVLRHLDVYQFDGDKRRSIERRGAAVDADGRVTDQPGSWNDVPAEADETFENDQGGNYPETLPTGIQKLAEVLAPADGCADVTGGCLLSAVGDMFSSYVVSPDVTARLWRALATDASIEDLGNTTDRLGRKAAVFAADAPDGVQRTLLLLDPETGRYLGSESVLVEPSPDFGFKPPVVTQFTALVQASRIPESSVPDDSTTTTY